MCCDLIVLACVAELLLMHNMFKAEDFVIGVCGDRKGYTPEGEGLCDTPAARGCPRVVSRRKDT
jgi:hypothetical protein